MKKPMRENETKVESIPVHQIEPTVELSDSFSIPCGKAKYKTEAAIKEHLDRLTFIQHGRTKKPASYYKCHHCKGWHLTSKKKDNI